MVNGKIGKYKVLAASGGFSSRYACRPLGREIRGVNAHGGTRRNFLKRGYCEFALLRVPPCRSPRLSVVFALSAVLAFLHSRMSGANASDPCEFNNDLLMLWKFPQQFISLRHFEIPEIKTGGYRTPNK
jgi:hypothetical protein